MMDIECSFPMINRRFFGFSLFPWWIHNLVHWTSMNPSLSRWSPAWSFRTHLFGLDQIKESFLLPLVRVIGIGLIVWPVSVSLAAATIYHVTEKIALLSKQADMSIHFLPPSSAPNRGGRSSLVPRSMVPRDDDRFVFRVFFLRCQCTFVTAKFTWRGVATK